MSVVLGTARTAGRMLRSQACSTSSTPFFMLEIGCICIFVVSVFTLPSSLRTESYGSFIPWLRHVVHSLAAGTSLALGTVSTWLAISRELQVLRDWSRRGLGWKTVDIPLITEQPQMWNSFKMWVRVSSALALGLLLVNVCLPAMGILLGALGKSMPVMDWVMANTLRIPVKSVAKIWSTLSLTQPTWGVGVWATVRVGFETLSTDIVRQLELYYPERTTQALSILFNSFLHLTRLSSHIFHWLSPLGRLLAFYIPEILRTIFIFQERILPLKPYFFTAHHWAMHQLFLGIHSAAETVASLPNEMAEAFLFTAIFTVPLTALLLHRPLAHFKQFFGCRNFPLILAFSLSCYMSAFWLTEALILGVVRFLYVCQGHTVFFDDVYELLPQIPHPHIHFRALQLLVTLAGVVSVFLAVSMTADERRPKPLFVQTSVKLTRVAEQVPEHEELLSDSSVDDDIENDDYLNRRQFNSTSPEAKQRCDTISENLVPEDGDGDGDADHELSRTSIYEEDGEESSPCMSKLSEKRSPAEGKKRMAQLLDSSAEEASDRETPCVEDFGQRSNRQTNEQPIRVRGRTWTGMTPDIIGRRSFQQTATATATDDSFTAYRQTSATVLAHTASSQDSELLSVNRQMPVPLLKMPGDFPVSGFRPSREIRRTMAPTTSSGSSNSQAENRADPFRVDLPPNNNDPNRMRKSVQNIQKFRSTLKERVAPF